MNEQKVYKNVIIIFDDELCRQKLITTIYFDGHTHKALHFSMDLMTI